MRPSKMRPSNLVSHRKFAALGAFTLAAVPLLLLVAGCADKKTDVIDSRNHLVEAREAINAGDSAKAIELLKASIAARPNTWAYLELAKLQLAGGEDQAALENCELGLKLEPDSADLLWLQGEAKKPEGKRFQGRFKNPPSASK